MEEGRVVQTTVTYAGRLPLKVRPDEFLDGLYAERDHYLDALREIDIHVRSTSDPIPYIIETLKKSLPEYKDE